jgi:hypothetical protein
LLFEKKREILTADLYTCLYNFWCERYEIPKTFRLMVFGSLLELGGLSMKKF